MAKTNWTLEDILLPEDFNQIGREINSKAENTLATQTVNGLQSKDDKKKLDGIEAGAQKNTVLSVNGKIGTVTLAASDVGAATIAEAQAKVNEHAIKKDNPHGVTKDQIGLSNVDNVKQASKTEFNALSQTVDVHKADYANPHKVSSAQINKLASNSKKNSDLLTTFPEGISVMQTGVALTGADAFPSQWGTLTTHRVGDYGYQIFGHQNSVTGFINVRSFNNTTNTWHPWIQQESTTGAQVKVDNHAKNYVLHTGYVATTGTANTYIATLNPALSAYVEGVSLRLKINVTNTGPSTLKVNGLGAKPIKKADGTDINVGQLKAGGIYEVVYNGTNFQLSSGGSDLSDADLLSLRNSIDSIFDS